MIHAQGRHESMMLFSAATARTNREAKSNQANTYHSSTKPSREDDVFFMKLLIEHIVSSKKFLRTSSSPHKTFPNDKYVASKEVWGERKLFYRPLKK